MLHIQFTADDLAATRFLPEPAPLLEMKFAARGLRRGVRASWGERWRLDALSALPRSTRPLVRQLGEHFSWTVTPTFAAGAGLDEALDAAMSGSRQRMRDDLALFYSARNSGAPLWPRFASTRADTRVLQHAMRTMFTAAAEPYWTDIRANHLSELTQHGRLLACRGVEAALTTTIPGASWSEGWLRIDSPQDHTVRLGGRGS